MNSQPDSGDTIIALKFSGNNPRKQELLAALRDAEDRGLEHWIFKILMEWMGSQGKEDAEVEQVRTK